MSRTIQDVNPRETIAPLSKPGWSRKTDNTDDRRQEIDNLASTMKRRSQEVLKIMDVLLNVNKKY